MPSSRTSKLRALADSAARVGKEDNKWHPHLPETNHTFNGYDSIEQISNTKTFGIQPHVLSAGPKSNSFVSGGSTLQQLSNKNNSNHKKPSLHIFRDERIFISNQSLRHKQLYNKSSNIYKHNKRYNLRTRPINQQRIFRNTLTLGLFVISLSGISNGPHVTVGFSPFGFDYNPGLTDYDNPYRISPLISNQPRSHYNRASYARFLNSDPLEIMSSSNRFTDDPSNQPGGSSNSPGLISDWVSLLGGSSTVPQDSLDAHIRKILVPRVSGTQGNIDVRNYIVQSLERNNYQVELDSFTDTTPTGKVNFANIIASSNPKACRQLVLACHYDSKLMNGFLGASDSAVPCAMLLELSKTFKNSFRESASTDNGKSLGLRFIFFDGEEAFVEWSATDSLYGSRHLAQKWERQAAPSHCKTTTGGQMNELKRIEMFVLLDLIGPSDTNFVMYNKKLKSHYDSMQRYERAYMSRAGMQATTSGTAFKSRYVPLDFMQDDHVPFKDRGVPILSLLAHPFPRVWHTIGDNYSSIDFPRTRRILHVIEQLVANYTQSRS